MRPWIKNTLKFVLFLGLSVLLFWLVYRDQDWDELMQVLRHDVDYTWVAVACLMGMASHLCRALRWQLLVESMGYRIRLANGFMGVIVGYFANLAIPRMGEFTRCGVVAKYEKIPFPNLLGNVVTERVIDMLILLALTLLMVLTQFKQLGIFLDANPEIRTNLFRLFHSAWMLAVAAGVAVLAVAAWKLFLKKRLQGRIRHFLHGLKDGLLSVRDVRHRGGAHLLRAGELRHGGASPGRHRRLAFHGHRLPHDLPPRRARHGGYGKDIRPPYPRSHDAPLHCGRCRVCHCHAALQP